MNKFFVSDNVYKERISICKSCVYYFKPTGNCKVCLCFMKIKSRIASMECPQKYWSKTTEVETPDDLPQDIIDEVLLVWKDIKTGRAKNVTAKKKMVELYNIIYNGNFKPTTNCSSCLQSCLDGIKKVYKKYV